MGFLFNATGIHVNPGNAFEDNPKLTQSLCLDSDSRKQRHASVMNDQPFD